MIERERFFFISDGVTLNCENTECWSYKSFWPFLTFWRLLLSLFLLAVGLFSFFGTNGSNPLFYFQLLPFYMNIVTVWKRFMGFYMVIYNNTHNIFSLSQQSNGFAFCWKGYWQKSYYWCVHRIEVVGCEKLIYFHCDKECVMSTEIYIRNRVSFIIKAVLPHVI